jgi:uncharacterized protein (DUF1501 family)
MKRRTFIGRLASTGIVLPIAMGFPRVRAFAKSPAGSQFMGIASATNDNIFVLIRMAGGNDGLNTVVPFTDANYYAARDADTIALKADDVVKLPDHGTLGLHPNLAPLAELYGEKKVAIVQNVGYPNQNLSHFRSTDIWLTGSDADVYWSSGWYGRYLEEKYPTYPDVLPTDPFAIELGTYLSTTLIGDRNNMGVAFADVSYIPGQPEPDPVAATHAGDEEEYVRDILRQSNIFTNAILAAVTRQATNKVTYPANNTLATSLSLIARTIAGGLGTQFYIVNVGSYDTHTNQITQQGNLHQAFADAVLAFQRDLEAFGLDGRVAMMTISEFGRRVASNGTGTDHGSAAPLFVIGTGVNGGVYGSDPNLSDLEGPGNLKMQYDFRQIYASVLGQWFGAADGEIQPAALPRHFEQLPIFRQVSSAVSLSEEAGSGVTLGQNYPNPVGDGTTIPVGGIAAGTAAWLTLTNLDGRELLRQAVMPGQQAVAIDTRGLPSGTYLYTLVAGTVRRTRSMTVAH